MPASLFSVLIHPSVSSSFCLSSLGPASTFLRDAGCPPSLVVGGGVAFMEEFGKVTDEVPIPGAWRGCPFQVRGDMEMLYSRKWSRSSTSPSDAPAAGCSHTCVKSAAAIESLTPLDDSLASQR